MTSKTTSHLLMAENHISVQLAHKMPVYSHMMNRVLHLAQILMNFCWGKMIRCSAKPCILSFFLNSFNTFNEPCQEKTGYLHMQKTKTQISFAVTAKLISAFVFATRIVQSLYLLNPKFHASRNLLWLYSPVYVGPGWKPRRPVFSQ